MTIFQPKISIVIPVYNGANYMAQAIDSALAQDYPNFEVIVVNDGSNDAGETERIARSYGNRIRYFAKENGGVATALNMALDAMEGSYFSWLSHDDLYVPNKLSHQVRILEGLEAKDTVLYSNYCVIDDQSRVVHEVRFEHMHTRAQLAMPLFPLTRGMIHGCTLLVSRRLFDRYGQFDKRLKATQDYDLWFRMLRAEKVHFDPMPTVRSRVHPEQGSRTLPQVEPEGVALWRRFIEDVTADEAAQLYGTQYRYLCSTADFLKGTPYAAAAPVAEAKAARVLADSRVSVVIPFRDRVTWTLEALNSAQQQSHPHVEIILVDDGSDEDVTPILQAASLDARVRYIRQEAKGAAAARNTGIGQASGRYIAFLDSDDWWHPEKIARQLAFMEANAFVISHTDYMRRDDASGKEVLVETSYCGGKAYPRVIASCPIATPTVMIRSDVARGWRFPDKVSVGEDIIAWLDILVDHDLGALPEPLATVRLSSRTTSANPARQQRGMLNILSFVIGHPRHGRHHAEIIALLDAVRRVEEAGLSRPQPSAATAAEHAVVAHHPGRVSSRVGFRQWGYLVRAGLTSLRHYGVVTTLKRTRRWLLDLR